MNFPSLWLFFSFLAGEIFCFFLSPNFFFLFFLGIFSLLFSFLSYKKRKLFLSDIFILFLFFFLGAFWFKPYSLRIQSSFLRGEVKVKGKITEPPVYYSNFSLYKIRSNYVFSGKDSFYFAGSILVKDYSLRGVCCFDTYLFKGRLRKSSYRGRSYVLYLKKDSPPFKLKKNRDFRKIPLGVSQRISSLFKESFPPRIYTFLSAVFLGRKEIYFSELRKIFIEAGTCHILAISGLHIGIISFIFLSILKGLGFKKRVRLLLTVPLVLFYAFLSGARPPVLRATLMFLVYSFSFLLRRKFLLFNSLALAGLIDLLLRPDDFLSVSFQLSFLACFSIGLGFRYFYSPKRLTFLEKIKILFFTSLFANVGLAGLISFYFGKIYLLSIFINILVIPYLGLIFSSLFVFLAFFFIEPLGKVVGLSCTFLTWVFLKINYFFSNFGCSYLNYKASLVSVSVYYSFVLIILLLRLNWLRRKAFSK